MSDQMKSKYVPAADGLFELTASKAQIQQTKIVEAAIVAFAKNGIEKTTYTSLAKDCGISRSLVHHYFPTLDSLFLLAAKYARRTLLQCAQEGLLSHPSDERKQLDGYIAGCFKWVELFPDQAKFWMLFFYQASLGDQAQTENTNLVSAGHERIEKLILSGKKKGYFDFKDARQTAKAIQILITGAIVSVATEKDYLTIENVTPLVQAQVRRLLQ